MNKIKLNIYTKIRGIININKNNKIIKLNNFLYNKFLINSYLYNNNYKFIKIKKYKK